MTYFVKKARYISYILSVVNYVLFVKTAHALDTGLSKAAEVAGLTKTGTPAADLPTKIGQLVGSVLAFVGVIFLILMIYGGFKWMTARGSPEDVKKARDIITNAVIGLIIVSGAYLLVNFILDSVLTATQ